MTIPILETERLIMRGHRIDDFPLSAAVWSNPEVVRYIGGKPSNRQQSWSRILTFVGHWQLMGFGYWAVEEKSTGLYVGEVGFSDFKREITPSIEGRPEIGWVLNPLAHGKGFATEAVKAALAWGDSNFSSLGFDSRVACIIDPGNLASLRVAAKCGFKKAADAIYLNEPVILFERA